MNKSLSKDKDWESSYIEDILDITAKKYTNKMSFVKVTSFGRRDTFEKLFARSADGSHITKMILETDSLGPEHVCALVDWGLMRLKNLKILSLRNNSIGYAGAKAIGMPLLRTTRCRSWESEAADLDPMGEGNHPGAAR